MSIMEVHIHGAGSVAIHIHAKDTKDDSKTQTVEEWPFMSRCFICGMGSHFRDQCPSRNQTFPRRGRSGTTTSLPDGDAIAIEGEWHTVAGATQCKECAWLLPQVLVDGKCGRCISEFPENSGQFPCRLCGYRSHVANYYDQDLRKACSWQQVFPPSAVDQALPVHANAIEVSGGLGLDTILPDQEPGAVPLPNHVEDNIM